MRLFRKLIAIFLKQFDLGSAIAVRLTKLTGKSKFPTHPKHLVTQKPWFTSHIEKTDTVLDLGSGNGQNAIKAAKVSKKVIGLEINDTLIEIAKATARSKGIKNVSFTRANLEEKLKFRNDYFDKIIFLDVLEHIVKRDQILEEIERIIKPRGLLFLAVPNSQTSWKKFQRSAGIGSYSDPDHKIEFSEKSIKNLISKHGFKIIEFHYGKYDIPLRGLFDIIGAFSISLYKSTLNWRTRKVIQNPQEASGFEIVAAKKP